MKNTTITWNYLEVDCDIPDFTLGLFMDQVEEETGKFPKFTDLVPDDMLKTMGVTF